MWRARRQTTGTGVGGARGDRGRWGKGGKRGLGGKAWEGAGWRAGEVLQHRVAAGGVGGVS